MPDISVKIGTVAVNRDARKVPARFSDSAKAKMAEAFAAALKKAPGFTADGKADGPGFSVDLTLDEVTIGTGQVAVVVKAVINTAPKAELKRAVTGRAKVPGDTSDGAVIAGITAATDALMTQQVFPAIRQIVNAP